MATHPPRRRIKFCNVALGQRFYDPISDEYFVKQSESLAAMVTGMGDATVPDEFEADDVVGIDLNQAVAGRKAGFGSVASCPTTASIGKIETRRHRTRNGQVRTPKQGADPCFERLVRAL